MLLELSTSSTTTTTSTSTRCSRSASSRCSRRWRSTPATRSRTSPTCRSTSPSCCTDPDVGERRFARVKVPPILPRFVVMPDGERFVPLEQVIAAHLDQLFPGMEIDGPLPLPGHPQRRPHPRGGGGRRPARGGRDRAAPPAVRPCRAPRDRRRRCPTRSATCSSASSTSTTTTSTRSTARSTSAGSGRCTPSTVPT